MVAEGVATSKAIHELAKKHQVDMPMANAVYSVLYEGKDAYRATYDLMTRDAKGE
ncbi:Glycerol-3-phosphate dehydrogenase [NAD(P)+] [compost metagenome]